MSLEAILRGAFYLSMTEARPERWTGDRAQVAALYKELGPVIHRQCLSLLKDPEEAADATHEVFLRLVTSGKFHDREHAAAWIYKVATRHCLNLLRDAGRRRAKLGPVVLDVAPSVTADVFPARQLTQTVLAHFDETTCAIAVGVLVDGIEQTELARLLGISRKTVQRKLDRFRTEARALLEDEVKKP